MTNADRALDLFARQYNCAQAVVAAFGPDHGISHEDCLRMAAGFGGGIGRLGETCGAVTGAIMVLGLRHGGATAPAGGGENTGQSADPAAKAAFYERVRAFVAEFKARHQSITCRELLGCDLSTAEGWSEAQAREVHKNLCPQFVRSAAELLEKSAGQ